MELKVKFLILCAIVALAHSSPMPQEIGEEVETTTAAVSRPSRPTLPRPNRPLINAITSAFQSINNAFSSAGNLAQNALGTVTASGYTVAQNAADSANNFMNSAADSFQNGINSVTSTVNQNINLAAAAWRPTAGAPEIVATDENGSPIPIESLAEPEVTNIQA